jgi:hypothetical protein
MYAVVVNANIAEGQFDPARKHLRETVVPRVSQQPGLVKAYWSTSSDSRSGLSFVVFKTRQDAESAANMVRTTPPPPGVTLAGVEIREIVAEA